MAYLPIPIIEFTYRNYAGRVEVRTVQPRAIHFGDTGAFHGHTFDWSLEAFDCDRGADRRFLLRDILGSHPHFHVMDNLRNPNEPRMNSYADALLEVLTELLLAQPWQHN